MKLQTAQQSPRNSPVGPSPVASGKPSVANTLVPGSVGDGFSTKPRAVARPVSATVPITAQGVMDLNDADIVAASPDDRAQMVNVLLSAPTVYFDGHQPTDDEQIEDAQARSASMMKILGAAKDPISFDRTYFQVDARALGHQLDHDQKKALRATIESFRATAKPGDWDGYLQYLDGVAGVPGSGKNKINFLIDGKQVVPAVAQAISEAKSSIDIDLFQLEPDAIGKQLVDALADKVKQGLHVRVLIDDFGTIHPGKEPAKQLLDVLRHSGVEVRENKGHGLLKSGLDHRKLMVIDGKVGFTGGMNVGNDYQVKWHDQQTRIEGPAVAKLQDAFLERWAAHGGTIPADQQEGLFPRLSEAPDGSETHVVPHAGEGKDRNIKAAYLRAIDTAQTSIRIANPYFTDPDIVSRLCDAARRGVKVQVVIPRENDMMISLRAARAYYPEMIKAGVEVYEYKGKMAHDKVATIDGTWSTYGSSNLDGHSLTFNYELNCVTVDPKVAEDINARLFDVDVGASDRITHYDPTLRDKVDKDLGWLI